MSAGTEGRELHRTLLILTLALVSGVVLFGAVVAVLTVDGREPSMTLTMPVRAGVAAVGLLLLASAHVAGASLSGVAPRSTPEVAVGKIRTGVIVAMAMRESVGLMGSVLGFVTGDLLLMSALVAASAATMILGIPGQAQIEDALRRGS